MEALSRWTRRFSLCLARSRATAGLFRAPPIALADGNRSRLHLASQAVALVSTAVWSVVADRFVLSAPILDAAADRLPTAAGGRRTGGSASLAIFQIDAVAVLHSE